MKTNIENITSIKRNLTLEIPADLASKTRQSIINNLKKSAKIKGFKAGKAPNNVIENLYNDQIFQQLTENLVSTHMPAALKEHNLEPIGIPTLEDCIWEPSNDFVITISFEVYPEFTFDNWENLALNKMKVNVTSKEINKNLDELRSKMAVLTAVEEDRAVNKKDDVVDINYSAYDGETEIPEIKDNKATVEVGAGKFFPEFEEALPGMKKGELKNIFVTFPKEHRDKKLANKKITFKTTIEEIKEKKLPELDDEFAKDFDLENVESLKDLQQKIKEDLIKSSEKQNEYSLQKQIAEKLVEAANIEAPSALIEREAENMVNSLKQNLMQNQIDIKNINLNEVELKANYRTEAEKNVKASLILENIAAKNNIEATEEDLTKEIEMYAEQTGQPTAAIREFHEKRNLMGTIKYRLKLQKTFELIISKANITELEETEKTETENKKD